jgi:WD40 repeat protein
MVHGMAKIGDTVWTCSSDKSIKIWSESGRLIKTLEGHSGRVFSLIPIGEAHVWSCSWDTTLIIWNAKVSTDYAHVDLSLNALLRNLLFCKN